MNSSSLVNSNGVSLEPSRAWRASLIFAVLATGVAAALALVMLALQAEPASAQISIGSIVCPILRSLQATFGGFLGGLFSSLLAAFGC